MNVGVLYSWHQENCGGQLNGHPHEYNLACSVCGRYVQPKPKDELGDPNSKFVVLMGLEQGNVFWSTNTKGDDVTKLADGTLVYKVIKYTDSEEEAKEVWNNHYGNPKTLQDLLKLNMNSVKQNKGV